MKAIVTQDGTGEFYAIIVREQKNGEQVVLHGYKGHHFKTRAAAEKSTAAYIAKVSK